ncbi:hypothetical protein B0J13DRAFT_621092 [Dactylonectria estremocensis]|uniref:Uncharacterized protein n=1 Tax=Dactylonectria estremocensis TaxID=1079267 RepID=A0A9P9EZR7_9HYPO|nr:hypothetical protein B0J13DRAFT_621092 [Dactylonectria estremocensis]
MDDEENTLFNIQVSDASDDEERESKQARRTGQTEEAWAAVRRDYRPKAENGNIYKTIKLPIENGASKQLLQEVLHAVEELYFFRHYERAVHFITETISSGGGLDDDTRRSLLTYQEKCQKKLGAQV